MSIRIDESSLTGSVGVEQLESTGIETASRMANLQLMFQRYAPSIVRINVKTREGDLSNGAGFHIGDGYLVTARHVLEGNELVEILGHRYLYGSPIHVLETYFPHNKQTDIAILKTDFSLESYLQRTTIHLGADRELEKTDYIRIGDHLDDWLGDWDTLSKVILLGYPRIPMSANLPLVGVEGEVNAVIDKYIGGHPHFIISSIPRGGFSGGPVISEHGVLLGVFTESLHSADLPSELGFGAALSVQPLWNLMGENNIYPDNANGALLRELSNPRPHECES